LAGHNVATANSAGVKQGVTTFYDPDGMLTGGGLPDTHPGSFDNTWHGGGEVKVETETGLQPVIEMGARQYHVELGRFLEVDPIEGGVHNDYGYVADPVNQSDRTGLQTPAEDSYCSQLRNKFMCIQLYFTKRDFNFYFGEVDDGLDNAKKHVILAAVLYFRYGQDGAVAILNRHEFASCSGRGDEHERMDCHNNSR
jgi:RHS repeat-associated protein